jgi:hypothetical protein
MPAIFGMAASRASAGILKTLGIAVGDSLSAETVAHFDADRRTHAIWPVPMADLGFTSLYGMDVRPSGPMPMQSRAAAGTGGEHRACR